MCSGADCACHDVPDVNPSSNTSAGFLFFMTVPHVHVLHIHLRHVVSGMLLRLRWLMLMLMLLPNIAVIRTKVEADEVGGSWSYSILRHRRHAECKNQDCNELSVSVS